jgi:hypothetical protein
MSVSWAGTLPLTQSSLCVCRPAYLVAALTIHFDGMEIYISSSIFFPSSWMPHGSEVVSARGIEASGKDAPLASYHHLPPIPHHAPALLHTFHHHPRRLNVSLYDRLYRSTRLPQDRPPRPFPAKYVYVVNDGFERGSGWSDLVKFAVWVGFGLGAGWERRGCAKNGRIVSWRR